MRTLAGISLLVALIAQGPVSRPAQDGVVTGQVRSRDGLPAAGVRIVAQPVPAVGEPQSDGSVFASLAQSDAEGRYRLEGIPPGRYYIAAGFVTSLTYYPGVAVIPDARVVEVPGGATITSIDFMLTRSAGVRVSGRLKDFPDHPGAAGVRVLLQPVSVPSGSVRLTDVPVHPGGTFEFTRVPPGSYTLRMSIASSVANPIQVGDGDVSDIEVPLPPVVPGRVVLEGGGELPIQRAALAAGVADPPALVRLQLRGTSGPTVNVNAPVLPTGAFLLFAPVGEYRVVVSLLPLGYAVKSMSHGGVNLLESALKISEGVKEEIQVVLVRTPGVTVSGRVTGAPISESPNQMWLALQSTIQPSTLGIIEQRVSETVPQADGTFTFHNIPPGAYTVRALPNPSAAQTITVPPDGLRDLEVKVLPTPQSAGAIAVAPIAAAPIPPTAPISINGAPISINGRVVTAPGSEMPRTIRLSVYGIAPRRELEAPVNADGTFQFRTVPPGEFDLNLDGSPPSSRNFTSAQNVAGIEVKTSAPVSGRVVMADGGVPPLITILHTFAAGELGGAYGSPTRQRSLPLNPDRSFSVNVVRGDQLISVGDLPAGVSVKSITYGSTDLLSAPLRVSVPLSSEIVVTLSRETPQE